MCKREISDSLKKSLRRLIAQRSTNVFQRLQVHQNLIHFRQSATSPYQVNEENPPSRPLDQTNASGTRYLRAPLFGLRPSSVVSWFIKS